MYLSKGFSDYLSKPIQTEKLLGILKKYIKNFGQLFKKKMFEYDVIVNCVMWDTNRKDRIIYKEDLKKMKKALHLMLALALFVCGFPAPLKSYLRHIYYLQYSVVPDDKCKLVI